MLDALSVDVALAGEEIVLGAMNQPDLKLRGKIRRLCRCQDREGAKLYLEQRPD
jgi:hypothetical protein